MEQMVCILHLDLLQEWNGDRLEVLDILEELLVSQYILVLLVGHPEVYLDLD